LDFFIKMLLLELIIVVLIQILVIK